MADCPKCGYALGPFDRTCPRCARLGLTSGSGQQEIDQLLTRPKPSATPTARGPRRQLIVGTAAAAVIIVGGLFIFSQLRQPGSGFWPGRPTTRADSARAEPPQGAGAGSSSLAATEAGSDFRLVGCPFALTPGRSVGLRADAPAASLSFANVDSAADTVTRISLGSWSIAGVAGAPLRLIIKAAAVSGTDLQESDYTSATVTFGDQQIGRAEIPDSDFMWQDQPFELYNGAALVATFDNTVGYAKARGQ